MIPILSIIIPCYNEADNIPLILEKCNNVITTLPTVEIILVNNGSTDNTTKVIENNLKINKYSNYKIVTITNNIGYGNGILQGLQQATAKVLAYTHADMQTNPIDILKAYQLYTNSNNELTIVKGKRINRNWLDAVFTYGMELYSNYKLRTKLNDINAQPKLFSQAFFNKIKENAPLDFSLDLYLLYKAKQMGSIIDFPVVFAKRQYGVAKGGGTLKGKWKLIKRTLKYINELQQQLLQ